MQKSVKFFLLFMLLLNVSACADNVEPSEPSDPGKAEISGTLPVLYIETENHEPIVSK